MEFDLEFPNEGAEFTGNGDDAFRVADSTCTKAAVAFAETFLHAPGEDFDFLALSVLPTR